tara:strand:+ start:21627 stop:23081 length:1455 start_codon:yes stop_codon:yes gene_type:complete
MNRRYIDEDEMYYDFIDNGMQETETEITLPAVAVSYTNDAVKASNYNYTPATLSFFAMVGQVIKDMIAIPSGINVDDTRLQVLWLQTSGTGKSTLTNWYLPIVEEAFRLINEKHGTNLDVFDITDYTDAALIGSFEQRREEIEEEDGRTRMIDVNVPIYGQLHGEGMAIWDEFEYSGVFKQSQHKENAIVYLNTFMNTMWGETFIISKKLKQGDEPIECICRRSVYGTSYIPKTLTSVITEKGVLQRLLIFIWEVPQDVQKKMRRKLISDYGTVQQKEAPKIKYSKSIATIYDAVKERYDEVGQDPLKVIKIAPDARDALLRECILMEEYISHSRPEVFQAVETFINRILKHIQKLAVLCAVAEAPSIKDKSKRFIVTQKNVQQAASIVRQCYKSLVSWLDEALRVEKVAVAQTANLGVFKAVYRDMDSNDGWVHKTLLLQEVRKKTQKGQQTIYNWWKKSIGEYFEENRINKSVYVKLKEDMT